MLLYRTLVTDALINEVEPLLRKLIQDAMMQGAGPDWYQAYGQTILSNYEDYDKLKKRIENGVAPTEAMDLSALFFLLFPYDAATGQPLGFPVTAMMYFARYCGKTEEQCGVLQRIRVIRNNAIHDDLDDKDQVPTQEYLLNGQQESAWLMDIEEIMKYFVPSFHLTSYKDALARLIAERQGKVQTPNPFAAVISESESIRRECDRIYHFDELKAPLARPLAGAAPWAASHSDLDELPWPSQQAAPAAAPAAPTAPTTRPAKPAAPAASDPLTNLANGIDRFFGMFSGKN